MLVNIAIETKLTPNSLIERRMTFNCQISNFMILLDPQKYLKDYKILTHTKIYYLII